MLKRILLFSLMLLLLAACSQEEPATPTLPAADASATLSAGVATPRCPRRSQKPQPPPPPLRRRALLLLFLISHWMKAA
ncbi:MAG: hypothetical protein M5U34_08770 [Chloroflexi bacterium]|nr:hypothetical protein [Chloroflexota bacterium]